MIGLSLALFLPFLSAFFGGWICLKGVALKRMTLKGIDAFAGGLLIAISIVHILPEADVEKNYLYVLLGFVIFYLISGISHGGSCSETACTEDHTSGWLLTFVAIGFHALVDGIAMGVGFKYSVKLGLVTLGAVVVHKAPMGFSLVGILLARAISPKRVPYLLLVFSLLSPVGVLLSWWSVGLRPEIIKTLMAFSGGTFLHICMAEIMPEIHEPDRKVMFCFMSGVALALIMKFLGG
ncbi:MAG: hypothetical protein D6778_07655 [Nitrospirae bacterium]|nr:MAG: hypothetical protein D6778_07655 [Nitrospirota bacterium]